MFYGCFYQFGVHVLDVLVIGGLLFWCPYLEPLILEALKGAAVNIMDIGAILRMHIRFLRKDSILAPPPESLFRMNVLRADQQF